MAVHAGDANGWSCAGHHINRDVLSAPPLTAVRFFSTVFLIAIEVLAGARSGQRARAEAALRLGDVQATGIRRYSAADIMKLSGLQVGQPLAIADIAMTAERMAAT